MQAKIETGYLHIITAGDIEGVLCLITDCHDYDHYVSLPEAVTYNGVLCGKTGWNSDKGRVYYQSDAALARVVSVAAHLIRTTGGLDRDAIAAALGLPREAVSDCLRRNQSWLAP